MLSNASSAVSRLRCVDRNLEKQKQYGFFRSYVKLVIYRYPWPRPGLVRQLQGSVS